jgi:hypothetical protein
LIKLILPAGKATPAPLVGPALGQHGVNIAAFCKEYNARTNDKAGLIIPVVCSHKIEAIHLFLKHRLRLFYWLTTAKIKRFFNPK